MVGVRAGLERVRCTSRPSVCPRLASFLPSALSLLPLLLFCPPSSSTLLSSSFSSFSAASCLLILAPDDDYFPLSKSPVETRYMQASFAHGCAHGRDASVYTRLWIRCVRVLLALSLSRKGDTTWSLGSATLRRASLTNKRRISHRKYGVGVIVTDARARLPFGIAEPQLHVFRCRAFVVWVIDTGETRDE